jgi:hypothetical protein
MAGGIVEEVEPLPGKLKALSSTPVLPKYIYIYYLENI